MHVRLFFQDAKESREAYESLRSEIIARKRSDISVRYGIEQRYLNFFTLEIINYLSLREIIQWIKWAQMEIYVYADDHLLANYNHFVQYCRHHRLVVGVITECPKNGLLPH